MSATETAMVALRDVLAGIWDFPVVARNANLDKLFEAWAGAEGTETKVAIVLREGEAEVIDTLAGDPPIFNLVHRAHVEWFAYGQEGDELETSFDLGMEKIADAVAADSTLGGAVSDCRLMEAPEYAAEPLGAGIVKSALVRVQMVFSSTRPF